MSPPITKKPRACAMVRVMLNNESAGTRSFLSTSKGMAEDSAGIKKHVSSDVTKAKKKRGMCERAGKWCHRSMPRKRLRCSRGVIIPLFGLHQAPSSSQIYFVYLSRIATGIPAFLAQFLPGETKDIKELYILLHVRVSRAGASPGS